MAIKDGSLRRLWQLCGFEGELVFLSFALWIAAI
jgi:hypothetical protein